MTKARQHAYQKGLWAEFLAGLYVRLCGFRIIAQRYKTPVGEIDLIATKGNTIIFIEVKARRDLDNALSSVSPQSQKRIVRAANHFLSRTPAYMNKDCRFDLIAIKWPFSLRHLDNAWRPES